ncbi:MAG: hypothetical protein AB1391_01520 [Candidatus Micrarchaeota archaeon]
MAKTKIKKSKSFKKKIGKKKTIKSAVARKSKKLKILGKSIIRKKNLHKTKTMRKNMLKEKKITKIIKKKIKIIKKKIKTQTPTPVRKISSELKNMFLNSEVRHWIIELGGENTLEVIMNLNTTPNDEELSKKLKIKVSEIRAVLNKLHGFGLVDYLRNKNSETGWYSYMWLLNEKRIIEWIKEKEANKNLYRPREGSIFYFCKQCGLESTMDFETASECLFKCKICNSSLILLDDEMFEQFKKVKNTKENV